MSSKQQATETKVLELEENLLDKVIEETLVKAQLETTPKPCGKLNIPLLRRLQAHVLAHPEEFRMSRWLTSPSIMRLGEYHLSDSELCTLSLGCGTAACAAGTVSLWAVQEGRRVMRTMIGEIDWHETGRRELGLSKPAAFMLFHIRNWPSQFKPSKYGSESEAFSALVDYIIENCEEWAEF